MSRPGVPALLVGHLGPEYLVLPSLNPEAVKAHWDPHTSKRESSTQRNIQEGENHGAGGKQAPSERR